MQKLTKALCSLVKQAAKLTGRPFRVYDKDVFGDVVTDVDKQVETFIVDKLNQKFPEFDIVSEEFNPDHELTANCFIIDPIDGTKNFAAGIPLWGMQIAALQDGKVVSCVIYLPQLNELYFADTDGAFLNDQRLAISANQTQWPIYALDGGDKWSALMELERTVNRNFRYFACASVAYAWVAAGRMQGYIFRNNTKWDYLPGMYLVEMAGGVVLDAPGAHIAATNKQMLDTLAKYPNTADVPTK